MVLELTSRPVVDEDSPGLRLAFGEELNERLLQVSGRFDRESIFAKGLSRYTVATSTFIEEPACFGGRSIGQNESSNCSKRFEQQAGEERDATLSR